MRFYGMDDKQTVLAPKRTYRKPADAPNRPLEKTVLAQVIKALRADPRVAHVERSQSGLLRDGDRFIRVGFRGKLDITGMLKSGRYFEVECKRPGAMPDVRQGLRIAKIRENGGISGYCWSVDSALALLP